MREGLRQLNGYRRGYSLGEVLVALVIGALVLTAILTVYGRVNRSAEAVLSEIESPALATEVLQLIAEDLERIVGAGQNTSIQIQNGFDSGFVRAQLVLRRTYRDSKNEEQGFEEILWRAGYDYEGSVPGLVIYRGHEGIVLEDKLLDGKRAELEDNYPLVPICRGVTFFRIEVPKGEEFVDRWSDASLPPGVRVTLSFAQPYETVRGTWDVSDYEKISRTVAIDKTRTIKFVLPSAGQPGAEPNETTSEQEPKNEDATKDTDATKGTDAPTPERTRRR